MNSFLMELLVVGIATAIVGLMVMSVLPKLFNNQLANVGLALFVTGLLVHLLAEVSGVNKWYCKNGYACSRK